MIITNDGREIGIDLPPSHSTAPLAFAAAGAQAGAVAGEEFMTAYAGKEPDGFMAGLETALESAKQTMLAGGASKAEIDEWMAAFFAEFTPRFNSWSIVAGAKSSFHVTGATKLIAALANARP